MTLRSSQPPGRATRSGPCRKKDVNHITLLNNLYSTYADATGGAGTEVVGSDKPTLFTAQSVAKNYKLFIKSFGNSVFVTATDPVSLNLSKDDQVWTFNSFATS